MKYVLFINLLLGFILPSFAQQEKVFLEWAKQTKGNGALLGQWCTKMRVDSENNIYIIGTKRDSVDFDYSENSYFLNPSNRNFIAKYNEHADLIWAKDIEASDFLIELIDFDFDHENNILLVGFSPAQTINFTPGSSFGEHTLNETQVFCAKYNSGGDFLNITFFTRGSAGVASMAICNTTQTISISGIYLSHVNFDLNPNSDYFMTGGGQRHGYIANYSFDGTLHWVHSINVSNVANFNERLAVLMDENGYTFWSGHFRGAIQLDSINQSEVLISEQPTNLLNDIFLIKYDNEGNYIWQSHLNAPINSTLGRRKILYDESTIYMAVVTLDSLTYRAYNELGNEQELFISTETIKHSIFEIDPLDGSILGRMNFLDYQNLGIFDFIFDADNNIFITASIPTNGVIDFNPDPDEEFILQATGNHNEFYLAKYDAIGNFKWAFSGQSNGASFSSGRHISLLNDNNLVLVGDFRGNINVAAYGETPVYLTYFPHLNPHMFFCKYRQEIITPPQEPLEPGSLLLYPNPTHTSHTLVVGADSSSFLQIDLYDIQGRKIKEIYRGNLAETDLSIQVDVSDLASGLYLYAILLNDERKSIRFVKE